MGIDACVFTPGELTDEHRAALAEIAPTLQFEQSRVWFADDDYHGTPVVEVCTLSRYWTPEYLRGNWPEIRLALQALRAVFGVAHYGNDHDVVARGPFLPDDEATYDAAWSASKGAP